MHGKEKKRRINEVTLLANNLAIARKKNGDIHSELATGATEHSWPDNVLWLLT